MLATDDANKTAVVIDPAKTAGQEGLGPVSVGIASDLIERKGPQRELSACSLPEQ